MTEPLLKITGLTKQFGGLTAVDDFHLSIPKGAIYGLIGPNGAGKTTVFNMVTGIIPPTSGTIVFDGKDITGQQPHLIARRGIARTFQNIKLFESLTVFKNVLTVAQAQMTYNLLESTLHIGRYRKQEKEMEAFSHSILEQMGLAPYADMISSNLAYGLQRRVEIARAMALKPKLLILDEPAAGMNEDESLALVELIVSLRDQFDLTVLVIDHHMDMIMRLCEKITVLNFGKYIAFGTPEEIQANDHVIEAYLGVDDE